MKLITDRDGFYKVKVGEQIGYRYLVDAIVDKGAFGQVVRCTDEKENGKIVAVKLSSNKKRDTENAAKEAKYLEKILGKDPDKYCIVKMLDHFYFRRHFVIVFEMLDMNLYKFIMQPSFKGWQSDQLRKIGKQLLNGLAHLNRIKIIHCDLKPENILFTDASKESVKIIDFGASCFDFRHGFQYVQSRFYRCPEVLLGLPYD